MICGKCQAPLPDGGVFCPKCGASQKKEASTVREPEETLWMDRYSAKASAGSWMLYALFAAGMVVLRVAVPAIPVLKSFPILAAVIAAPALVLAAVVLLRRLSVRYRLTNYRLFVERGLLRRKISELELVRVDDIEVTQGLLERIFNVGTIILLTSDSSDPRLDLCGIADPIQVKEQIRAHVRKRREGVVNLNTV